MDLHAWIALVTLIASVLLFVFKWIPMEATALAIPVVLAGRGPAARRALGAVLVAGALAAAVGEFDHLADGFFIEHRAGRVAGAVHEVQERFCHFFRLSCLKIRRMNPGFENFKMGFVIRQGHRTAKGCCLENRLDRQGDRAQLRVMRRNGRR